jgi:hypothetical protein
MILSAPVSQRRGGAVYSSSGYGSTAQRLDRYDLFRPAVLDVFELVASAKVRFGSRLCIVGRLGQQRDVVLLDDAEPHAVAAQLTPLARGDPAESGAYEVMFIRAEY